MRRNEEEDGEEEERHLVEGGVGGGEEEGQGEPVRLPPRAGGVGAPRHQPGHGWTNKINKIK